MGKSIFSTRYQKVCEEKDISKTGAHAQKCLGCTKENISKVLNSDKLPSVDFIVAAADMLNVSIDYLVGRTERDCFDMEERWEQSHDGNIPEYQIALRSFFARLSREEIDMAIDLLHTMANSELNRR